jgi:hypothetical protein
MKTYYLIILLTNLIIFSAKSGAQDHFFIKNDGVRIRANAQSDARILGLLDTNDEVEIVKEPETFNDANYVSIKILSTKNEIIPADKYFISKDFLSEKIIDFKEFTGNYFIVINIASEMLRLYLRNCDGLICHNIMLMETEVVVGEDSNNSPDTSGKGRSVLGSFRITGWTKFYEDGEGHYPSWYKENYPELPKPQIHDPRIWLNKNFMPSNSSGKKTGVMRGAFGWYTAFLGPDHYNQWLHGTIGWGADKDFYIKDTKKLFPNIFFDPRSSGCTRNNNEAIAYLRHIVSTGTPVMKIYAVEKLSDPLLKNYPVSVSEWSYVLTKTKSKEADRNAVLNYLGITEAELDTYWKITRTTEISLDPKDPLLQILEVGTYKIDQHPDAVKYTPGERMGRFGRKLGQNGNVYGVFSKDMRGTYFVDTGELENYQHPQKVMQIGGFPDELIPGWMQRTF